MNYVVRTIKVEELQALLNVVQEHSFLPVTVLPALYQTGTDEDGTPFSFLDEVVVILMDAAAPQPDDDLDSGVTAAEVLGDAGEVVTPSETQTQAGA